ncbi:MAG: hypothetical protein MHPSP_002507, partial [Paramarteilia canceri]
TLATTPSQVPNQPRGKKGKVSQSNISNSSGNTTRLSTKSELNSADSKYKGRRCKTTSKTLSDLKTQSEPSNTFLSGR